jgi:hypothetical protein
MFACSLAVLLVVGAMAPAAANAWSLGKKTKTDAITSQSQGALISVQVYNKGELIQNIKMEGQVYTIQPHQSLTITAAEGTAIYADSPGNGFQKGDVLFTINSAMKGAKVTFN